MIPDSDGVEYAREIDQCYRNVFASSEGRRVIGDILTSHHFGVTLDPENKAQIAEYNSGLVIAHRAGVLDSLYLQLGMKREEK